MSIYTFSNTWKDIKNGKVCVIIASFVYCMVTWIRIVFKGFRLRKNINYTRKGRGRGKDALKGKEQK